MTENKEPSVVSKDTTRMAWSSTRTSSCATDWDRLRVIVKSKAIPANMPWKNEMDLLSLVSIEFLSSTISVSKVFVVKDEIDLADLDSSK